MKPRGTFHPVPPRPPNSSLMMSGAPSRPGHEQPHPGPVQMLDPEPEPEPTPQLFPRLAFLSGFCFGIVAGLLAAVYLLGFEPPPVKAEPRPTVLTSRVQK